MAKWTGAPHFTEVFVPMLHASRRVQWTAELNDRARNSLLGRSARLLHAHEASVVTVESCRRTGAPPRH
jgi:hypothetical protein